MDITEATQITVNGFRNSGTTYYDGMTDDEVIASVVRTHDAADFADSTDRDEVALRVVLAAEAERMSNPANWTDKEFADLEAWVEERLIGKRA